MLIWAHLVYLAILYQFVHLNHDKTSNIFSRCYVRYHYHPIAVKDGRCQKNGLSGAQSLST